MVITTFFTFYSSFFWEMCILRLFPNAAFQGYKPLIYVPSAFSGRKVCGFVYCFEFSKVVSVLKQLLNIFQMAYEELL